ncbi:MAG: hypothetical protein R2762_25085 [Bryobacteraceae bacterium]
MSKEHPVVVRHRGGHISSSYNSKAFELADVESRDAKSGWGRLTAMPAAR